MEHLKHLGGNLTNKLRNCYCSSRRSRNNTHLDFPGSARLSKLSLIGLCILFSLIPSAYCLKDNNRLRDRFLKNFGCDTLKAPKVTKPYLPQCGCGYYGKRIRKGDNREGLYNVTVTASTGTLISYECKQCRLCTGRLVKRQCKAKVDTICSNECEDPCHEFNDFLGRCVPKRTLCPTEPPARTTVVTSTSSTSPSAVTSEKPPTIPVTKGGVTVPLVIHEPSKPGKAASTQPDSLHPWLIAATIVIAVSIVAVLGIIIYIVRDRSRSAMAKSSTTTIATDVSSEPTSGAVNV